MSFWISLIFSFPRSVMRALAEFRERRLIWLTPLVLLLLLTAIVFLFVGSIQPLAPFIYSLI